MSLPIADTQFVEATWIMIVKSIVIFAVIFGIVPVMTVVERKLIGRFQHRYGPNRVGPFGLLQPLAELFQLISKQGFRPANAIPHANQSSAARRKCPCASQLSCRLPPSRSSPPPRRCRCPAATRPRNLPASTSMRWISTSCRPRWRSSTHPS